MIVGLTGYKQHGKDTVGSILVEQHGFVRVSFADALKQSAAALFDVPVELWDKLKNLPDAIVTLTYEVGGIGRAMTVREFLQRYGTEAHRDIFGGTFWTDVVRDQVASTDADIVITDVRFDEEATLVRDFGGPVVKVFRPGAPIEITHASEELPEHDYEVWNGGTIDDLANAVRFDILGHGLPDKFTGGLR